MLFLILWCFTSLLSGVLTKGVSNAMMFTLWPRLSHYKHDESIVFIPPATKFRGGILDSPCSSVRLSVCLSVCLSVRPSVRPWVGVRMITLILFSGFNFFFTYITWVKILHGIEYQRPTSLNMRILADHVTYSFLAFMKSIFHFCLGCYCGGYSQNGRSNLSSWYYDITVARLFAWWFDSCRRSDAMWCHHYNSVTGLCAGNSPGTGEFPAQMASNAENVSIWWRYQVDLDYQ